MSPIDTWDGATYVFTGGPNSFLTVLSVIVAVAMFVGFIVVMARHERHAYAQMIEHRPIEKGPAVEGEPTAY